ncbi:hypothetical protein T296_14240 [Pantoea agglomerans Eh318]|nr:hypothetical protein T296_14240 [Pantoea agglomerans Eh318]
MCQIKSRLTHIHKFHSYHVIDLNNAQIVDLMSQISKREKSAIAGRQRSGLIIIDE